MSKTDQDNAERHDDKSKSDKDSTLNKELDDTFPASDPPASTQPGGGVTGAEVKPRKETTPNR